jgi:F0F1-type ATP synthase membrane subunit b/b'
MQLINISIVIYVLNRFLFKPYLTFIKEEDKKRIDVENAYADLE